MSAQSVSDLKTLIASYGHVSHNVAESGHEAGLIVEACKSALKTQAECFLISHESEPILRKCCLDTTPTRVREYVGSSHNPHMSARTFAQVRADLLVQFTSFSCFRLDNTVENHLVFRDAVAVTGWKTTLQLAAIAASCPAICAEAADEIKTLCVRQGCASQHYSLLVRAVAEHSRPDCAGLGLVRKLCSGPGITPQGADSQLLYWHTYVGCICHDLHNSLKWSLAGELEDVEMLKKF